MNEDVTGHIVRIQREMRFQAMMRNMEDTGLAMMKDGASGDEVMDMVRDYVSVMDRVLGKDWGQP